MTDNLISIENPTRLFGQHLTIPDNNRILFSGKFGIGKTTFLNSFFSTKEIYEPIILRPINYTVASNEDIYKLIKYDILYQLLEKNLVLVDDFGEFSKLEIASHYMATIDLKQLTPFIKAIPEIGGSISNILTGLNDLISSYKKFKKGIEKNADEVKINSFLEEVEAHYLFENDFITEIINSTIKRLNNSKKEGGAVLIIDDLDRIDPEHIFRLFNVFSTHFNAYREGENKFGFYRIIFVCDVINVRSIFHSKYGVNTDFNGYIDKFYSTKIFKYNNKHSIAKFIVDSISKMKESSELINKEDVKFLVEVLNSMIEYGVINLRNLIKAPIEKEEGVIREIFDYEKLGKEEFGKLYFAPVGMVLSYLIGDIDSLIYLLGRCIELKSDNQYAHIKLPRSIEEASLNEYFIPMLEYNKRGNTHEPSYFKLGVINYHYKFDYEDNMTAKIIAVKMNDNPVIEPGAVWLWLFNSVKVLKSYSVN